MTGLAELAVRAGFASHDVLRQLCLPEFDCFFWPSSRPSVLSAWYGHVPFAHWLVSSTRPRTIVELGTHNGASYAAFCEAVLRSGLAARCYAVDTWEGDEHAGRYGEEVYQDFRHFHDPKYGGFSTLLRARFDDAAPSFPDGIIDLLHIDGMHAYEAVRHDFETWLPKMSDRGTILFHDVAEKHHGFGVWKLWDELRRRYPSFTFSHCNGLGVLAVGGNVSPAVASLCGLNEREATVVRGRFERLGEPEAVRCAAMIAALTSQEQPAPAGSPHAMTTTPAISHYLMHHAWCLEQVAPWLSRPMPHREALAGFRRLNETNGATFVFTVEHGTVALEEKPEHARGELYDLAVSRALLYRSLLEAASQLCPEVVTSLALYVGDGALPDSGVPVFAFQKPAGNPSLLLPDHDFLMSGFFGDARHRDGLTYEGKRCSAVFVGSTSGGVVTAEALRCVSLPRLSAAVFFRDNPEVEFRLPNLVQCEGAEAEALARAMGFGDGVHVPWTEQFRHRFIISMDGNGATCSRVALALMSNSVLVKYASPHLLYYFSGLQPWRHYLPVAGDEEVLRIVRLERERPGLFEPVARAGREFAEQYLTREAITQYTADLLRLYSQILTDPPAWTVAPAAGIQVLAHVRNRADILGSGAVGVGGRSSDEWIEGFALFPDGLALFPDGIAADELTYCAVLDNGTFSPWVAAGEFCGSRGLSQPLHGFAVRLHGAASERFACTSAASFTDGTALAPSSDRAVCVAPSRAPLQSMQIELSSTVVPGEPHPSATGDSATPDPAKLSLRELMLGFESVGDNCEFGIVQRRCGAEPLGLFRFSAAPLDHLAAGVADGFLGMADHENLLLKLNDAPVHGPREYLLHQRKYGLTYHTFVVEGEMSFETPFLRERRKLAFLHAKFMEDLADAERIFVVKRNYPLAESEVVPLWHALRRHGPNTLLWVVPADATHPGGTVEVRGDGLLQGYLDRFAPYDDATNVSIECWITLCRNAAEVRFRMHSSEATAVDPTTAEAKRELLPGSSDPAPVLG